MTWFVALTEKDCFPILVKENSIDIPYTNPNSSFTLENFIITEKYPVIQENSISWETRPYAYLIGLEKMTCFPDINRMIREIDNYDGKTLIVDDVEYKLDKQRNDFRGGYFFSKGITFWFYDSKMYIGQNGEWIQKDIIWR